MKFNKWTVALAAIGVVSLASAARADEQPMQLNAVQTALSSTTLSGYVDTAATWRPGTDQGAVYYDPTPTYAFAKNDGFSLNAVDIALNHPEDESPWAAGYHIEMMYGADAVGVPLTDNYSYSYSYYGPTSHDAISGLAIRQAYLTLRTPIGNGIDWKVGVFDTIIGYESSSDPLNPNYTRSYGYSVEPTTHTGVLATYKVNDMVTVSAGVADSSFVNSFTPTTVYESQKAYMGSVALTAPDSAGWMSGATLTMGVVNGTDSQQYGTGSQTSWYVGATLPTPVKALKVGATFDYYDQRPAEYASYYDNNYYYDYSHGDGETWVLGLYGNYQINDKASFNLRGEYLQDDTGNFYGNYDRYPIEFARNEAEEITATLQYNLWMNVISRAEFRWDHVEHGNAFGFNSTTGDPNRANDFLLALNLIYQF